MEAKLAEYRLRKRRENLIESVKSKFNNLIMRNNGQQETEKIIDKSAIEISDTADSDENLSSTEDDVLIEQESHLTTLDIVLYILYFLLWLTSYIIFIKFGFGIVYLIVSALVGIYLNTRTGKKRRDEISAYSVFNKNCESIDGTLKAEQFEREIRFGAISVR